MSTAKYLSQKQLHQLNTYTKDMTNQLDNISISNQLADISISNQTSVTVEKEFNELSINEKNKCIII